jgi:hypothetical protein
MSVRPPAWLEQPLAAVGLPWPDGDSGKLAVMAQLWSEFSSEVYNIRARAERAIEPIAGYDNDGPAMDAIRAWWHDERGPKANLTVASQAADDVANSLHSRAVQNDALQFAYTAQLVTLAPLLSGGAAGAAALYVAKKLVVNFLLAVIFAAVAFWAGYTIGAYLVRPMPEVDPEADNDPYRRRDPRPTPGVLDDGPQPLYTPEPTPTPGREPCAYNGSLSYSPSIGGRVWDERVAGDGIVAIQGRDNNDGSHTVAIDGVVKPAIGRSGFEGKWQIARDSVGLPGGFYDAAHLFGPIWGSEAAEGIFLAPTGANRGATLGIENHVRRLGEQANLVVDSYGNRGFVELHAEATSHPSHAWRNPYRPGDDGGYLLLRRSTYDIKVCHPDNNGGFYVAARQNLMLEVDPPRPDGRPGGARTYAH